MPKKFRKVAVVGTGTLGTQIAILSACRDYDVAAYDSDEGAFHKAMQNLKAFIKIPGGKSMFALENWEKGSERIKFFMTLEEAVLDADMVIEVVPENLALKREVFRRLDHLAPPGAILATNSSSIPISRIENATGRPDKCLNIHFYSPVTGLNMVDIMGGSKTTAETIEAGKAWILSIGCVPLTVKKESLGFCFNRVWRAIKRETLYMWADGFVDFTDIDRAWMIFSGMSQGPFGLMDQVGLDVVYDIEMVYYNESKDPKDHPPGALKAMVNRKELGLKTGKGFYTYPDTEYSRPGFLKG